MVTIAEMPKYKAYKESGVDWLGLIPEHWDLKPLKHGANVVLGKMLCPSNKGGYFLRQYLKSKNIQWLKVDVSSVDEMWFSKEELDLYKLEIGDLVLSEGGEVGKTCIWQGELAECYIQNSAHRVRMFEENNNRFFLYQMYSCGNRGYFDAIVNRVSIAHLTREKLVNVKFVFPIQHEQALIAKYLDQKTAQIDEAIAIKQQQISLLKERKQIIVQQAVTQGLDPNVPMKDSGVDWIGMIPAHWEVRRSKFLFTQRKEKAWKEDVQLSATQAYGVIPQEQYEELTGKRVVKILFHLDKRKHVEKDDFVISMRSFQGGLERAWSQGCIRSSYVVLKASEKIDPSFYGYLLKLPSYIKALQQTASFIRDGQDLNFDNFSQVDLFIPPIEEQAMIANYIDAFMKSSDEGSILLEQQIEKLKEYKTTLINSAVTGKIKITQEMVEQ
ncbi:restriction endonuclease subunit S [Methylotuvimicrobium alcaliphilum]|uniref:Type I site-specific restriction-modification system, S subunit n=1 Tax=Methylotuvimicrobium alcaliphilum (strain DSM 19304 / NCIMB 14124 / VKM B-2133 / 20Z) TaxID=1091494 RepID=G4SXG5_META2|nr:restriction endonuclease subunit S [Methylotuvimicrobium alcaliphilum]CCE25329.1 putative type I site-specific restriction-modification system, S subunit [Methylotuvimicrobium alcaliphilum 20Z]